jgi:hypothetical protein
MVTLASLGEFNNLSRDHLCERIFAVNEAKRLQYVFKDASHKSDEFRVKRISFKKPVHGSPQAPLF